MTEFPIYLLVLLVFMNRYLLGLHMKIIKGSGFDRKVDYEPSVTVVTPMFNEGEGIYHTIHSLLGQLYPVDKLEVMIVDDCSTDDSFEWAQKAQVGHPNVTLLRNPHNMGKRKSINRAVRQARGDIIVSVDSDVVVDPRAVRELVQRFARPDIAAVGGRVHVANANENWLTRMQAIKYYFGYEYLKNVERVFQSVMCLSGCLTAYRKEVLLKLEPILEGRSVLGIPIKYGEDRYLTRQIVKAGYRTVSTLDAVCWTTAPNTLTKYFAQQLRWRRSNIIDFFGGMVHAWRLHPMVTIHYLSLYALLLAYPIIIFEKISDGSFWDLAMMHGAVLTLLGLIYRMGTRDYPAEQRVGALNFLTMTFVMPVTYLLLTPLALFTLDSSSWETRGHSVALGNQDSLPPLATQGTGSLGSPPGLVQTKTTL